MQFHFHKNGFALRFALKKKHKGTREMAYCSRMVPKSLAENYSSLFYHSSKLTRVAFVTHSFSWMVGRRWEKTQPIMAG